MSRYIMNVKLSFSVQILTGEDWNVVMYDGIQAYGGIKVREWAENTDLYFFPVTEEYECWQMKQC
jgi:hypothetical protein